MTSDEQALLEALGGWIADVVSHDGWPGDDVVVPGEKIAEGDLLLDRLNVYMGRMSQDEADTAAAQREKEIEAVRADLSWRAPGGGDETAS